MNYTDPLEDMQPCTATPCNNDTVNALESDSIGGIGCGDCTTEMVDPLETIVKPPCNTDNIPTFENKVISVNSKDGIVVLTTDDINAGPNNKYLTLSNLMNLISAESPISLDTDTGVFSLLPSGVVVDTHGDATHYPIITVDAYGRITSVSTSEFPQLSIESIKEADINGELAYAYTGYVSDKNGNYLTAYNSVQSENSNNALYAESSYASDIAKKLTVDNVDYLWLDNGIIKVNNAINTCGFNISLEHPDTYSKGNITGVNGLYANFAYIESIWGDSKYFVNGNNTSTINPTPSDIYFSTKNKDQNDVYASISSQVYGSEQTNRDLIKFFRVEDNPFFDIEINSRQWSINAEGLFNGTVNNTNLLGNFWDGVSSSGDLRAGPSGDNPIPLPASITTQNWSINTSGDAKFNLLKLLDLNNNLYSEVSTYAESLTFKSSNPSSQSTVELSPSGIYTTQFNGGRIDIVHPVLGATENFAPVIPKTNSVLAVSVNGQTANDLGQITVDLGTADDLNGVWYDDGTYLMANDGTTDATLLYRGIKTWYWRITPDANLTLGSDFRTGNTLGRTIITPNYADYGSGYAGGGLPLITANYNGDGVGQIILRRPTITDYVNVSAASISFVSGNNNTDLNPSGETSLNFVRDNSQGFLMGTFYETTQNFFPPAFIGRKARGTKASPTAVQAGDYLFQLGGRGHDGTAFATGSSGAVIIGAKAAFTTTSRPTYVALEYTPSSSIVRVEGARLDSNGYFGVGTTNPTATVHAFGSIATPIIAERNTQANTTFQVKNSVTSVWFGQDGAGNFGVSRTSADLGNFSDMLKIDRVSGKLSIRTGTNTSIGTGTLVNGVVTITNTCCTNSSQVYAFLSNENSSTALGILKTIPSDGSFIVQSKRISSPGTNESGDQSTFRYLIIN